MTENVGSALNSTIKENINQVVAFAAINHFRECLLLAQSGHGNELSVMSAFGGKADIA